MTDRGQKTTGDFRVGPQLSKNENKGTVFLENWPPNFPSLLQSVATAYIQELWPKGF